MKIGKFKEIIRERSRIAAECCDEWLFGIEKMLERRNRDAK